MGAETQPEITRRSRKLRGRDWLSALPSDSVLSTRPLRPIILWSAALDSGVSVQPLIEKRGYFIPCKQICNFAGWRSIGG